MSNIKIHFYHRNDSEWRETDIELRTKGKPEIDYLSESFDVLLDGDRIGVLRRMPKHVTHQVHGRIRYDNKPRTRFQAEALTWDDRSGIARDTRLEALEDILEKYLATYVDSTHLANRKTPRWMRCDLH